MEVEVNMDNVIINKQTISRPDHISRRDWMWFWERARDAEPVVYCPKCGERIDWLIAL